METAKYLDRTLAKYAGSFDIERPYRINGKEYAAYGHYISQQEKYVLTRKVNLWKIRGHEHVVFALCDRVTHDDLEEARRAMIEYMEPELVCSGNRYPEKDHMYSYLTFAFICETKPDAETIREIERFRYSRDYLFSFRGRTEAHIICVDMETKSVFTNRAARQMKKFYLSTFREIQLGKPGYEEAFLGLK
ncbi:MAG: hypothetical protein ACOYJJ_04155 [Anaerovoracaceae bacterium]